MESMLDQAVQPVPLAEVEDTVSSIMAEALELRNDTGISDRIQTIRSGLHLRGLILSRLLYEWKENCSEFGISPDDWEDHVYASTGLSLQSIRKYVQVWRVIFANPEVPEDVKRELASKPMQGLMLLPAAVQDGQLTSDDWDQISDAPDPYTIREVVRKARGQVTSSNTTISITWKRDGTLVARRGDEAVAFGFLQHTFQSDVDEAAVQRILRATGIQQE